jgi:hypothetical protein
MAAGVRTTGPAITWRTCHEDFIGNLVADVKYHIIDLRFGFGCSPRLIFGLSSGPTKNLSDILISRIIRCARPSAYKRY